MNKWSRLFRAGVLHTLIEPTSRWLWRPCYGRLVCSIFLPSRTIRGWLVQQVRMDWSEDKWDYIFKGNTKNKNLVLSQEILFQTRSLNYLDMLSNYFVIHLIKTSLSIHLKILLLLPEVQTKFYPEQEYMWKGLKPKRYLSYCYFSEECRIFGFPHHLRFRMNGTNLSI